MCKKNKLLQKWITVLLAAVFLISVSALTAAADPGADDGGVPVADDGGEPVGDDGGAPADTPVDDGGNIDQGGDNGGDSDAGSIDGDYDIGNIDTDNNDGGAPADTPVDDGGNIDQGADTDNAGNNDSGEGNNDSGNNDNALPEVSIPESYQEQYEQLRDSYLNGQDDLSDIISRYVPNQNLDSLPKVSSEEVVEATADPLPDVAVSDATLFSGIVMWLCVAVGISVVVGVMVSKRTHRKGT